MPEPAIAEPPKTNEPPASLKALFQIPSDLVDPPAPKVIPDGEKAEPPPVEPKPAVVPPTPEPKKNDLTSRIAPDFAALEAKPDVPVAPDPDLTELDAAIAEAKTGKKKADLTKFRDQLATLKTENQTLKSKPASPVADPEIKTVLDAAIKERDDALARLERYDLQAHPAFQEKYLKPRQQKFDDAYNLIKEVGGNPEALRHAMALVGEPRIEALEGIAESIPHQMMRGRFERLIEGIDADSRIINEKLANHRQTIQEEAKNETIRRHENNEKMAKEWKSLLGAARSDLLENIKLEVLQKVGKSDFEWWDKQVDEIDQVAEEILLKSTPQKAAIAAYLAASAGPLRAMFHAERKRANALEQENRELKGADPTLTRERLAAKVEGDGIAADDIISRLRTGAYKK
jgi:hypothetical protein